MGRQAMPNESELRTFAELHKALNDRGYFISQKVRVLDAVEEAAKRPEATAVQTAAIGTELLTLWRQAAGPFGEHHPWLEAGDWSYAFRSHFDFVVHAPWGEKYPQHPLFAVEFDGPSHESAEARQRDYRKNRLCLASGLPLLRVDDRLLWTSDQRLSLVQWLVDCWADYRENFADWKKERDEEYNELSDWEKDDPWMLADHPELDIDWVFDISHGFPLNAALARRMARRYGFAWPGGVREVDWPESPRWQVTRWMPPIQMLDAGFRERWVSDLWLNGPDGAEVHLQGLYAVDQAYPLGPGEADVSWVAFEQGERPPFLPAGPWLHAPVLLGKEMTIRSALRHIEEWLHAHAR